MEYESIWAVSLKEKKMWITYSLDLSKGVEPCLVGLPGTLSLNLIIIAWINIKRLIFNKDLILDY